MKTTENSTMSTTISDGTKAAAFDYSTGDVGENTIGGWIDDENYDSEKITITILKPHQSQLNSYIFQIPPPNETQNYRINYRLFFIFSISNVPHPYDGTFL